jgi:hypothetical protein
MSDGVKGSRYQYDLLPTCEEIVGSLSGASDYTNNFEDKVKWLKWRIDNWQPSLLKDFEVYNGYVYCLCVTTLEIVKDKVGVIWENGK